MSERHPDYLDHVIVCKVGSSSLVDERAAFDPARVVAIASEAAKIAAEGWRPIIVSSGAVAVGMGRLGLSERPRDIPGLQAAAAAGQAALTEAYARELAQFDLPCAQVLLNRRDVVNRESYLHIRHTFERLLELGVVAVVNENDTTSVTEFSFGDNDLLGAIVATLVGAERYVILTDIDGLYTADPTRDSAAERIDRIEAIDERILALAGGSASAIGTGGMRSKLHAARALMAAGIPMAIVSGSDPGALSAAVRGEVRGTLFAPSEENREPARKLWIALAGLPKGTIVVDDGAARALVERGASLLPVGVREVRGDFASGDVVSIVNPEGHLIARGVSRYSASELSKARGLKLDVIGRFLPEKADAPAVHRDELLVF